jgi:hypothetical protein
MPTISKQWRAWLAVLLTAVAAASVAWIALLAPRGAPERWFMPGPLGHVPGRTPPPPSPRAYLTRAMSGVDRFDGGDWARHNGLGAPLKFSHNLSHVFPPSLRAQHPEYFPLVGGERLRPASTGPVNWNPDLGNPAVARHAAEVARLYFDAHPRAESFSLGVNDGLIFGESPETLALVTPPGWFRGRPDYSRLVFTFMNRAATALDATHPGRYLGCLAYYWCEDVPPFPVRANVLPFLTADRSQGYDAAFRQEEFNLQDRWAKAGPRRLGLYDYLYGRGFLVPRIFTRLVAENLRHARRAGFTDYYAEVNPNWGLDGPMPWLVAQLLEDPERSAEKLLDEYYLRFFGRAAAPMRRFFERCEEQWMRQPGPPYWLKHYRNESQVDLFPSAVCRELRGLLNEAAQAADSPEVKARVAFVSDAFALTERFVAFCEARTALVRRQLRGKLAGEAAAQEIRQFVEARSALISIAIRLRWTQPPAAYPASLDDFLRDDPVFGATEDALETTQRVFPAQLNSLVEILAREEIPQIQAALQAWRERSAGVARERAEDGLLEGPVVPGRRIAGLAYGLDLPAAWSSKNEPVQDQEALLLPGAAHGGGVGLHLAGSADAALFQWTEALPGRSYDATVFVRGRVASGNIVALTLGWLDASQKPVGNVLLARLPEGEWSEWVRLRQGGVAPAGARWVGIGVRVQHQVTGDWADVDDFSLRETAAPAGPP